jgi:hypothetical protein
VFVAVAVIVATPVIVAVHVNGNDTVILIAPRGRSGVGAAFARALRGPGPSV